MAQIQVLYVAPDSKTTEQAVSALETAAPELSVSRTDVVSEVLGLLEAGSVDCLVVDWLASSERPQIVEAAHSRTPTVPIVWFTTEPADRVVDSFDGHTEYVYKQTPAEQGELLAHRIRSVVTCEADSAINDTSSEGDETDQAATEGLSEAIVDRSYAGILVFDSEGRITLLNPAAERLLGIPAADAIGNTCEALDMRTESDEPLPPGNRPVARVLESGEAVVDELVSIRADVDRQWLSISASPLANGKTVGGVVVTLDDVSAEVELETTLKTVLDRMTDGFLAFDTDLRFTYFSKQAIDPGRYPTEQVIGSTLSSLHPHLGQYESDLREVLETQEPQTVETHIPEPTDAWYRARLYPSESGISVFFREITDEKQQKRRLEQYKTIVESVQDGVCILDSDMDFVFVNRAFTELVDYAEADLLGYNAALVTDPADMEIARQQRAKLFAGDDDAAILSGELTTRSGGRVPVETWMTPIGLVDGERGTVGVVRDLSYRKQTEAMFTALYDAAHDLLSAQSTEEIAEIGVEAAASVLGFEDAIVLSYDEELNVFHPLAYTPSAETHLPAPLPISASESSIAGRAFFDAEPIATEDVSELPEAYNPETPYRRAMFVPLDEHGVLFVGDTETGTTTDQTRTVAELLGATLAAAFSRLSSEQRSKAHQQTLAERTAELETLAHTNAIVEALVDRLFEAATREEIEGAVCSILAEFDRYSFAWIGAAESPTDTIVPRASAGIEQGYLEWLGDHHADVDSAVDEPTYRVCDEGTPVLIDRISQDWQAEPWRKEALSRGYQSVFSVPIRHGEINYGVLSVYADTPSAFNEYIRTVLTEFGRIIGYAIASTELKQGLLADQRTEVELEIVDGDDVISELATRLDTQLRFEGFVPQSNDLPLLFFSADSIAAEALQAAAAETSEIETLRVVTQQNGTTLFETTVSGPVLAATLVDCGAIPTAIHTDGDRQQIMVTLPQTTDVRAFIDRLQVEYPSTTVVSRQARDHGIQTRETFHMQLLDSLTPRQRQTLQAAYFARYFDSPRGSTGTEIGESLGISQPTFTYHLRAALRSLLTMVFEESAEPTLDE